jgi:hypothetical protein
MKKELPEEFYPLFKEYITAMNDVDYDEQECIDIRNICCDYIEEMGLETKVGIYNARTEGDLFSVLHRQGFNYNHWIARNIEEEKQASLSHLISRV